MSPNGGRKVEVLEEQEMTQVVERNTLVVEGEEQHLDLASSTMDTQVIDPDHGDEQVESQYQLEEDNQLVDLEDMQHYEMIEVDEMGNPIEIVYASSTVHACYNDAEDTQYELEDPGLIRIRDFREIAEGYAVVKNLRDAENQADQSTEVDRDSKQLPFPCTLCTEKFHKKLFLNNHMEKRHGIKFVFTERGKKVKLIRMPQQLTAGEKLDPCVEALMQQNGQNSSNILGVQTLDLRKQAEEFPSAHEIDPFDLYPGTEKSERDFGAGILVNRIRTYAMKVALERNETPFVVYRPLRSKRLYLLSIHSLNEDTQLLLPASENDLNSAEGVESEPSFYFAHCAAFTGKPAVIKRPCTRFSHVAIVALAEQTVDENNKVQIKIHPSPASETVWLIKFKHFARTIIQCQPKRLRCLSFPPKVVPAPAPEPKEVDVSRTRVKRKYRKRNQDRELKEPKKHERDVCVLRRRRRRQIESSDEETDVEGKMESSNSDEDEDLPLFGLVVSPQERIRTPPVTPERKQRRHPVEREVLAPPKKKYARRGRPRKYPIEEGSKANV